MISHLCYPFPDTDALFTWKFLVFFFFVYSSFSLNLWLALKLQTMNCFFLENKRGQIRDIHLLCLSRHSHTTRNTMH
jgi:hypothetical protein